MKKRTDSPRSLAKALAGIRPRNGYHGWTVVTAGTVCSALSSPGQSFLLSLYVEPLIADTGVSRVGLATLYGACTLAAAACLPLAGRIADRVTGRRYMTWVLLCMALALALLASARGAAALAIAFFMLRLFGQGAIGLGTLTATVRWFRRRRARALSVVGLGYAAGEMLFPAVVLLLTALVGWRGSLWLLAVLYAAVFAPGIALLLRERDTAADDEYYREMVPPEITLGVIASHANRPFTVREATRTRTFWLALTIVVIMPMIMTGVIFHQVAFFAASQWPAELVVTAFFAYAVAGVLASIAAGVALDSVPVRWAFVAASIAGMAALGMTRLAVPASVGALLYGALLGIAGGFATAGNSVLWPSFFGIESLGAIKGIVSAVRNAATAVGATLVAALLSPGAALSPLTALGALLIVMLVCALFIEPPRGARWLQSESATPERQLAA